MIDFVRKFTIFISFVGSIHILHQKENGSLASNWVAGCSQADPSDPYGCNGLKLQSKFRRLHFVPNTFNRQGQCTSCVPALFPNVQMTGCCTALDDLDDLCATQEISVAAGNNCTNFEGGYCCYLSLAQGNSLTEGDVTVTETTVISSSETSVSSENTATVTTGSPTVTQPASTSTSIAASTTPHMDISTSEPVTLPASTDAAPSTTITSSTTTPTTQATTNTTMDTTVTETSQSTVTPTSNSTAVTTPSDTSNTTVITSTETPSTTETSTSASISTTTSTTSSTAEVTTIAETSDSTETSTSASTSAATPTTTSTTTAETTTTVEITSTETPATTTTQQIVTTTPTLNLVTGANDPNLLPTSNIAVQQLIVDLHNRVRRAEGAANMLKMQWDPAAASVAQDWANRCVAQHGPPERNGSTFSGCGQNIANGNGIQSWNFTVQIWGPNEKKIFTFGRNPCPDDFFEEVGHYTQIVWARTWQVGCGFAACANPVGNFFVCNYCPAGNVLPICQPYLPGTPENDGVCGKCGGVNSNECDSGLCTNTCSFTNKFSNCDTPAPNNPTTFPALIPDTSVCVNTNDQFVQACAATCKCRAQGLIY